MKKLDGAIGISQLVTAVLTVVVLGALMYTMTDFAVINASRNGSAAIAALLLLLPLLVIITVVVGFSKFAQD